MRVHRLQPADYREMPWRNGGGSTTEIAIEPTGAALGSAAPFLWRLSMARIEQDGPFSPFPGYDRTLVLLAGRGVALDFGAAAPPATLSAPLASIAFAGEYPTGCRLLGGPVRDFNAMVDRVRAKALVCPLVLPALGTWTGGLSGHTTLLYVEAGTVVVHLGEEAIGETAAAGETLRWTAPGLGARLVAAPGPAQVVLVDIAAV